MTAIIQAHQPAKRYSPRRSQTQPQPQPQPQLRVTGHATDPQPEATR